MGKMKEDSKFTSMPIPDQGDNRREPFNPMIIGSANSQSPMASPKNPEGSSLMKHEGIIMGQGSVTGKRQSVAGKSINRLPSERQDGRVV